MSLVMTPLSGTLNAQNVMFNHSSLYVLCCATTRVKCEVHYVTWMQDSRNCRK